MKKREKKLMKLKDSEFAKRLFENHVHVRGEMDCWDQHKELDTFINGIRFKSAADLIVYMADKDYNPRKMEIRHLCRNSKCCNLNHMEAKYKNLIRKPYKS